jgi:hypothetical protein
MPVSEHFKGHGNEVAQSMKRQYGGRWKEVFYATENKQKKKRRKKAARKR